MKLWMCAIILFAAMVAYATVPESNEPRVRTTIAICALTRSKPTWKSLADTALQQRLVPSIAKTITASERADHVYELHVGADDDDAFWVRRHAVIDHPAWLTVRFYFYAKTKQHRLPFNELTADAYGSGADYIVRINDDTEFLTVGWTTKAISALEGFDPPNVGVVGPRFREGNTAILTHDMVHRTHLDIFETYYPPVFDNWYVDDWITRVYGAARTAKLDDWWVGHRTHVHGQRYAESGHQRVHLESEVERGAARIAAWLARGVVSYSLYGSDPRYTDGIIANAKLMPEIYPGWRMRVYYGADVPDGILMRLRGYDWVELVPGNTVISPMVWRFLVASDRLVLRYVVRDADSRLSKRERTAVDEWVKSDKAFHVMRDHPSHSNFAISGGLWGGTRSAFPNMKNLLGVVGRAYVADMNFLTRRVWPVARRSVLQHDAFGCRSNRWGDTRPFPTPRNGLEHVGSVFIDGKMRQGDVDILKSSLGDECVHAYANDTGSEYAIDNSRLVASIGRGEKWRGTTLRVRVVSTSDAAATIRICPHDKTSTDTTTVWIIVGSIAASFLLVAAFLMLVIWNRRSVYTDYDKLPSPRTKIAS